LPADRRDNVVIDLFLGFGWQLLIVIMRQSQRTSQARLINR